MNKSLFAGASVAVFFAGLGAAFAQAADSDPLVVVANRVERPLSTIGNSVTVLDLAQIQASQAVLLSDLLAQTPGVSVTRNGGPGEATQLRIRGAETDQTLVLIDGVQINDPSAPGGGFDFGNLLVGDIARIEVLRGAQSALWGSQAIGGVVNIVTAQPTAGFGMDAEAEGGSYGTGRFKAGIGGKSDRLAWRLAGNYFRTDGFSAFDKKLGGSEDDGYRNGGASGRVTFDLTKNVQLDQRFYWIEARNDLDGFSSSPPFAFGDSPEYGKTRQFVDYSGLNVSLFDGGLKNRIAFQYTDIDRKNFDPTQTSPEIFYSTGRNTRIEYQGTWKITQGLQAVFGAQRERSTIETASPSAFDPNPIPLKRHASIDSFYGQAQAEILPGFTLSAGLRSDDHSSYGGKLTGQAAAAWALNSGDTILRASFGQGFKAPTLYQLFSDFGNPGLQPEQSNSWDAGVEQRLLQGRVLVSATYFERRTRNQIDFFSCFGSTAPLCAGSPFGFYDNIARTRTRGVELSGSAALFDGVVVSGNYSYIDTRDVSPTSFNEGNVLARRPKHLANLDASYRWPFKLTTAAAVHYSSASFDDAANFTRIKSYWTADLRASYPIGDHFEAFGRIENLFDRQYEVIYQYGTPGRSAYVGLRARF